jgi:hypothetical protein
MVARPGRGAEEPTNFLLVLVRLADGNTPPLLDAPPVNLTVGLPAPKRVRPLSTGHAGLYAIFTAVSVRPGRGT